MSAKPLRIMRIIARMNVGGPARHVGILSTRLDPGRFETILATGTVSPGERDMTEAAAGARIETVPGLGREVSAADPLAFLGLVRLMRRFRPAIVHTHTAKAGLLGRAAALACGVRRIFHTYHGHVFHSYFSPRVTRAIVGVERLLAPATERLIAISPGQRREIALALRIPEARIACVPLGLDLGPFLAVEGPSGALDGLGPGPRVGFVARLVPVKAPDRVLEIARRTAALVPGVSIVVVGGGPLEAGLRERAQGLPVRFLGWRDDVPRVLADLDAVILTSLNEGTPVSLIEAMAAARCVVAAPVGGVPDLVRDGETGILCEPDRMPEVLAALLGDPGRRRALGAAARADAAARFSATRLVRDIEGLYLGGGRRA